MKIEDGRITILVSGERITIELKDSESSTTFCKIELTAEQFATALGRLSYTRCESMELFGLEKLGKKLENKYFEFEVLDDTSGSTQPYLNQECLRALKKAGMEEWVSDNYYTSQNSFFNKDGKKYARVTIRRWTEKQHNG